MSVAILVLGATGRVGSLVVRELAAAGSSVGGLVRDPARAAALWPAGVHAVAGDLADAASVRRAMHGVQAVLISSPVHPQLAPWQCQAMHAAADAGVRRIVKLSGSAWTMRPGDCTTIGAAHAAAEAELQALVAAGRCQGVCIRPNAFLQGMLGRVVAEAQAGGRFALALGDARVAFADVRDIAAACAQALRATAPPAGIEVTGPAAVGGADIAVLLQRLLSRPVAYRPIEVAEAIDRARATGLSAFTLRHQQEVLLRLRAGAGEPVSAEFQAAVGRTPRTVDAYLAEACAARA
ncbi:MAG: NAD(P)H-binding protein [Proteobacteria bacterium]|nr:NAD(P)H-binding protein [Pseudomonadota bacterium]